MAHRVLPTDLDCVLGRSVDTGRAYEYIDNASLIVDEDLASSGLSDARKTKIELWLAAHFAVMATERAADLESERIDGLGTRNYGGERGLMLNSTRYGQQAMMLDTSNALRRIGRETLPGIFRTP